MSINELYQELIIDHGTEPRNYCCLDNFTNDAKGFNPLCGDKIHIYLEIDNNIINNVSFKGSGCAISMASASIMTETLKGKTIEEAKLFFKAFKAMVTDSDEDNNDNLSCTDAFEKLKALAGVKEFPSRVKCATLAWHTMNSAINNDLSLTKTE